MFNILKGWLNNAYYDFANSELGKKLLDFINTTMVASLPAPAQTLLSTIEKKVSSFVKP